MKLNLRHLIILGTIAATASLLCPKTPAQENETSNSVLVSMSGAHSHVEQAKYLRITSAKDFQSIYMQHLGKKPEEFDAYYNPHGVPTIDFQRCIVIAVFGGKGWNSAGIDVKSVIDGSELIVRFDDRSYQTAGPNGGGDQVCPYGFFVLPRSEKAVVLEEDVQQYIGGEPQWKERARFARIEPSGE